MDEIRKQIEEFQNQLIPHRLLIKYILLAYPAVLLACSLIVGLTLQYYFSISLYIWLILLAVFTVLFLLQKSAGRQYFMFIAACGCFVCLGSIRLLGYNTPATNDIRNIHFDDFTFAYIRAEIISEPRIIVADEDDWLFAEFSRSYPYTTFYAEIIEIKTTDNWQKARGMVKFYISQDVNSLNTGDRFQVFCKLKKFSGADNPGQFDVAKYMQRNSVYFSASVSHAEALKIIKKAASFKLRNEIRKLAIAALRADIEDSKETNLVEALVLGSRVKIDRSLYSDFVKTGLVHLICLSGLNVGILAACFWWIAKKFGLLHRGRSIAAICATIIFLLTVPPTSPTLRAGIMFITLCAGGLFNRQSKPLNSLAVSVILLLLIRPMDILNAGFQLSFATTSGIILFAPSFLDFFVLPFERFRGRPFFEILNTVFAIFAASCAAWLAAAPIIMWHFYQLQLLTAMWTVVASLPAAIITVLGTLKILLAGLLPGLALILGYIINFSARVLAEIVTAFARVPLCYIITGKISIYAVLLSYLLILLWKFALFRRQAILYFACPTGMLLLFVIGVFSNKYSPTKDLQLTVLSVGHGQAAVIKLAKDKSILIDAGSITRENIGMKIVNPFLDYTAADKLDYVFISHNDIDHYNGLAEILKVHRCKNLYTTPQFIYNPADSKADATLLDFIKSQNLPIGVMPQKISTGKITITRLWQQENPSEQLFSDNETSLVLLIEYAGRKILFCSDITKEAQNELKNLYPTLDIDIMISPHHGSRRTFEPAFLNAFKPEYLITSCCQARVDNISESIKEARQSFLTCKDGAITATISSGGEIKIKTFR